MATAQTISIVEHTTTSSPTPHVLYVIKTVIIGGEQHEVLRRYSQFVRLQEYLGDSFILPPKRILASSIVPLQWLDDDLIDERKTGLARYLNHLNTMPEIRSTDVFLQFLCSPSFGIDAFPTSASMPVMASRAMVPITRVSNQKESKVALVAAAYYPAWSLWTNPPDKIDFAKFDILFFAFATPNASSTLDWEGDSKETLRTLVERAHRSGKGTRVVLSIGGWMGSRWFSDVMKGTSSRTKFCDALVSAVNSFGLDGIDIDWEYPNSPGAGNPHLPADATNFLSFLRLLRAVLGPAKIISAAVAHLPWLGANGKPLTNVSDFAAVLTYVNIMNYDVNGSSSKPGPNAPLGNLCGTSEHPTATARSAFTQWTKAGFPAPKLLLGLPLYGYVSKSTAKKLSGSLACDLAERPTAAHPRDPCMEILMAPSGDLSSMWGQQIAFSQLVKTGALKKTSTGAYVGSNGYILAWDDCSDTPFLYNVARTTVVTYDDTWSIASKAQFAKESGMAGCFTWSLDQDDGLALQNVIRAHLGSA